MTAVFRKNSISGSEFATLMCMILNAANVRARSFLNSGVDKDYSGYVGLTDAAAIGLRLAHETMGPANIPSRIWQTALSNA